MQEYTREQLAVQISALRNIFDDVCIVDAGLQARLDETTFAPVAPADPIPALNAAGRGWKPQISDDGAFVFYQTIRVDSYPCVLVMTYSLPGSLPADEREANALLRALSQCGEELRRDYVTGVYNRSYLDGAFLGKLTEAARGGQPVGVVMARVNEYGEVLRTEGSTAADHCLNSAAGVLQLAAGMAVPENTVVRLEDGLFLIVTIGTAAAAMEHHLHQALEQSRCTFGITLSRRGTFTMRIGTADWAETGSWDLMLSLAEQRLNG